MKWGRNIGLAVFICVSCLISTGALASSNLLFNGSFDCTNNPMAGWQYDFTWLGNGLYMDNHNNITWLEKDGSRKGVARLHGIQSVINETGQGVWLDTKLIPYEYPCRYKFTVWARCEGDSGGPGPDARMIACAVMWQPGRTPRPDPDLSDMAPKPPHRLIQQGSGHMVYFTGKNNRDTSGVKTAWTKGETTFPDATPSGEELKRLKRADFIFLHICALFGSPGNLYIDDVSIEKMNEKIDIEAAEAKAAAEKAAKAKAKAAAEKAPTKKTLSK